MKLEGYFGATMLAAALSITSVSALAQESSYTPGTVWQFSSIQVEPGQFEKYVDYLAGNWRKINELGKKEGMVVSYHVFTVNDARKDEPDLILAVEYKDYYSNAQQLALQKKIEAMLASDAHKMDAASGERKVMRKLVGNMQLQELQLK
ncbi:hypothetical protein [Ideonella sp. YS5]|uniref:hypothetical protein n=1 Tax=Ideonella sp. YS5 TaxID=3453714 RepID=UPI003EEE3323